MNLATLRNIGIIAHIDAGKTTFSERVLFYSDQIHRMGEVHEGAATMDFMPEEQERGITIAAACITCHWGEYTLNLIDTPGHVDFTIEVERSLRVLDAAIGIFCAVGGVEPQSETVWHQAESFGIPKLAVINKMDRPGASFASVLTAMRERLGARPVPVTIPLGEGESFCGVLDLVREQRLVFEQSSQGRVVQATPFTAEDAVYAAPWREGLIDALTENDDVLLECCLAGLQPAPDKLDAVLRAATLERRLVPVFAASSLHNTGVQPVLDAVCRYLPGPADVSPAVARLPGSNEELLLPASAEAPFCGLIFKVSIEAGRKLAFVRVYAGTLREGDTLANAGQGGTERAMRLFRVYANRREPLAQASAGDIVVVQGLKQAHTGDTLCAPGSLCLLEPVRQYQPVIALAFEPKNSEEGEALDAALEVFAAEDPTVAVEMNEHTGQRVVSGMGELHLEVLHDRLRREYKLSPRVGNPQVVSRETLRTAAEATGVFDRDLGGQAHYGQVRLALAPLARGTGMRVDFACDTSGLPKPVLVALEQGITDACYCGPNGYAAEDISVTVLGVERKNGLGTAPGFHMAAQNAVRFAFEKGGTLLLEPLMEVSITVPENFLGSVISLLGARGARVEALNDKPGSKVVAALAPMRGLFGFATALRSATQGRASLVMRFVRFDTVG